MSKHRVSGHLAGTFETVLARASGGMDSHESLAVILEITKDDGWCVKFSVTRRDGQDIQSDIYASLSEAIRAYDKAGAA